MVVPVNEEDLEDPPAAAYKPIHALHFEELTKIWEADRRIPSVNSRRGWAKARNLNPINVHTWWYRRRPLAKKLKIRIPRETYEIDVGTPPIIPPPEEVPTTIKEENTDLLGPCCTLRVDRQSSSPSGSTELAKSDTCGSTDHIFTKNPLFEELSAEMGAYTRALSPSQPSEHDSLVTPLLDSDASPSPTSSPLPPSSPLRSSPPLWLPKDVAVTVDHEVNPQLDSELLQDTPIKGCSSISYMPVLSFALLGKPEELELKNTENWIPLPAEGTWCLHGYRLTFDGCLMGICSCAPLAF